MSWQYGGRFRDAARLQGSVRELPLVARVENLQDIFLTFYTDVHGSPVVHDPLAKGMVVRHVFGLEDQRNTGIIPVQDLPKEHLFFLCLAEWITGPGQDQSFEEGDRQMQALLERH